MSGAEVCEGIIAIDESQSSSSTNSEIDLAANEISELILEDTNKGLEKPLESAAATTPDSDGKGTEDSTSNEEGFAGTEIQPTSEEIKDNETVAVKKPRLQYSREDLISLMHHPLSREWPSHIDPSFQKIVGTSVKIDLDRLVKFTQENKHSGQPLDSAEPVTVATVVAPERTEPEVKKTKDPRERIKQEEQDGIILSPQRRSFGTGCRVQHHNLHSFLQNKRAELPVDCPPPREMHREMPTRRIGSGRIVRREEMEGLGNSDGREYRKDFGEQELRQRDWRMKTEGRYDKYRDENNSRNDKRRHYYEQERMPDRRDKRRDSRRIEFHEETPEWYTGGPSSQNECIELVGFDDDVKESRDRGQNSEKSSNYASKKINSRSNTPTIKEEDETEMTDEQKAVDATPGVVEPLQGNDQDLVQFSIDNIILGDFLDVGSGEVYHSSGQSRLKQFFHDSSSTAQEKTSSSNPLGTLFCGTEPAPPLTTSAPQFAPMSVAANNSSHNSVADLFNQNGSLGRLSAQLNNPPSVNDLLIGGKVQVLQDIEANLCNKQDNTDPNRNADQKGAFNEFLLNGGLKDEFASKGIPNRQPAIPNNAPTETDVLAMLLKNNGPGRNQSNGQKIAHNQLHMPYNSAMPTSPTFMGSQKPNHLSVPQPQSNQEMLMKVVQQQQQKKLPHLLPYGFQHQDPIKQLIGVGGMNVNSNPHAQGMVNPDVQMLLQRLAAGQLTEAQLLAQLGSQNSSAQQKDAITTVLKLLHSHHANILGQRSALTPSPTPGMNLVTTPISLSPRVVSPNPDVANMLSAPHVLPQRVSPLMFNTTLPGNPRRPPSHQELVAHTQSILQKALIKQELEKAKEKHRKREHDRIKSPNPSVNVLSSISNPMVDSRNCGKSQSPLAFTPTSVMRKMTEKDKNCSQEMNRHPNPPPGSNFYQNNTQMMQGMSAGGNVMNLDAKKCQEMCNSSLASNKNFLGPKTNIAMCGINPTNSGPMMPPPSRHIVQPHAPLSRHNQSHHQSVGRGQGTNMHGQIFGNIGQHSIQNRMQGPPPNSIHHLMASKNNNSFLGLKSDNPGMGQIGAPSNQGVNLANLFGRDIFTQAQNGKLPDLPGGQALSLEEVEKVQQNQANNLLPCYKYVR